MEFNINMIRQVSGVSEPADASTPDPRMLKGVAELAFMSTNNSLQPIFAGYKYLLEKIAKSTAIRIQDVIKYGDKESFIRMIGEMNVTAIESLEDLHLHDFAIKIEDKPNDKEIAILEGNIQASLTERAQTGKGGIDIEDAFFIRRIGNIKLAEQVLALRRRKRLLMDQQIAERNMQINAQMQERSNLVAGQMEVQKTQAEAQVKAQLKDREHEQWKEKQAILHAYKMEELRQESLIKAGQTEHEAEIENENGRRAARKPLII